MTAKQKFKIILFIFLALDVAAFGYLLIGGHTFAILEPRGFIASKERRLIIDVVLLMLIATLPAYAALFLIIWKNRHGAVEAQKPGPGRNGLLQAFIWLLPIFVISCIGILIWKTTHELDPNKPISSDVKPLTIEVVALNWKWLFIYPDQDIATVNYVEFPAGTPLNFKLTADAPMNTFWIPQLGGQIYAMAGMQNQLHLIADREGEYDGSASEINGEGYAGMRFKARSVSADDFDSWVSGIKNSATALNSAAYDELSKDSTDNPVTFYAPVQEGLFNDVMMKFMPPANNSNMQMNMEGMQ